MILQELTLFNFCLYAGEQVFDLAPSKSFGKHRPIVLCGGINGGGKTTLLDAVQLALYGNRAKTSKRGGLPYDDFLRECIHRGVAPTDGASISLSFRYASEGKDNLYEVCRRWAEKGAGIKEYLQVFKDGVLDDWLSGNWNTVVEELIPLGVSQLFFFDAEQIRFLAEDETSNEALSSAIKSLLGLDLAERLIADAKVVESRLAKETAVDPKQKKRLDDLESEILAKEDVKHKLKLELATLESESQRADEEARKAELAFASVGGKHWKQRSTLEQKKKDLLARIEEIKDRLLQLAETELPLSLVSSLLDDIQSQADAEVSNRNANILTDTLETRDKEVLAKIKKSKFDPSVIEALDDYLKADRFERAASKTVPIIHSLSDAARTTLSMATTSGFRERRELAKSELKNLDSLVHELETVERSLSAAPKEDTIKLVASDLKTANQKSAIANDRILRIEKELASAEYELGILRRDFERICRDQIEDELATEETRRISELSVKTQELMAQFLNRATAAKIDRLSARVTESFRFLLRKKALVERIEINPETFSITLFDVAGNSIPKSRLSEGEKQIFAISVLWGLAQASSRPLPAIIDTPMARLDEKHRDHLVERYFPNASHQVIILSTDTEIDQRYFEDLSPNIARSYYLNYNEKARQTTVEEGYFAPSDRHKAATRGVSA